MTMKKPPNSAATSFYIFHLHPGLSNDLINASTLAGQAFNRALRIVAAQSGFISQLFGLRLRYEKNHEINSKASFKHREEEVEEEKKEFQINEGQEVLIWVTNWESTSDYSAFSKSEDFEKKLEAELKLFADVSGFFNHEYAPSPNPRSIRHCVQWVGRQAEPLLKNTAPVFELAVITAKLGSGSEEDVAEVTDVISWDSSVDQIEAEHQFKSAVVGIISPSKPEEDEENELTRPQTKLLAILSTIAVDSAETDSMIRNINIKNGGSLQPQLLETMHFRLTRTRWCTRVKMELVEQIKSRYVD